MPGPEALDPAAVNLPARAREILIKGRTSWLKNTEVLDLLLNNKEYRFTVSREAPHRPPGGTFYMFNRRATRFFRKDGHDWRKKADGKTVKETHEKLKVANQDQLNCYYAHSQDKESLQRRCYWVLQGDESTVLVHYLDVRELNTVKARQTMAHAHSQAQMDREVQARPVRPDPQAIIHGSPALNLADIIQGHAHGPGLPPGLLASQLHLPPHPGQLQHQQEHQQELRRSTRPFKPVAAVMDQDRDSATASLESRQPSPSALSPLQSLPQSFLPRLPTKPSWEPAVQQAQAAAAGPDRPPTPTNVQNAQLGQPVTRTQSASALRPDLLHQDGTRIDRAPTAPEQQLDRALGHPQGVIPGTSQIPPHTGLQHVPGKDSQLPHTAISAALGSLAAARQHMGQPGIQGALTDPNWAALAARLAPIPTAQQAAWLLHAHDNRQLPQEPSSDSPRKRARLDPPSQDRPAFHAVPGPFPGHGAEGPKEKIEPGLYSRPLELPRGQYQAPLQPQVVSHPASAQAPTLHPPGAATSMAGFTLQPTSLPPNNSSENKLLSTFIHSESGHTQQPPPHTSLPSLSTDLNREAYQAAELSATLHRSQAPPITPVHSGQPPHKFVSGTELINTSISEPCASPWATQAPPDPHSLDRLAAMHDKGSKPQTVSSASLSDQQGLERLRAAGDPQPAARHDPSALQSSTRSLPGLPSSLPSLGHILHSNYASGPHHSTPMHVPWQQS